MSSSDQSGSVVTADQINYQQKMYSHPSYKFEPMYPNTFGQTISLNSSQTPVTIQVSPEVLNPGEFVLMYTVTLPAVANNYIWVAQQAFREISHLQYYSGSNMYMADVDNLQNYADITIKKELPADEFLSLDPLNGVYQNNSLVNVIPALRNANYNGNNTLTASFPANPSSINFTEPAYFSVGALGQCSNSFKTH